MKFLCVVLSWFLGFTIPKVFDLFMDSSTLDKLAKGEVSINSLLFIVFIQRFVSVLVAFIIFRLFGYDLQLFMVILLGLSVFIGQRYPSPKIIFANLAGIIVGGFVFL